jgi:hypothetical protein
MQTPAISLLAEPGWNSLYELEINAEAQKLGQFRTILVRVCRQGRLESPGNAQ